MGKSSGRRMDSGFEVNLVKKKKKRAMFVCPLRKENVGWCGGKD